MFVDGQWEYLDSLGEMPRYGVLAGYVHRLPGEIDVLDVGCGAGILCRYLDQSRVRYYGTDLSASAIAQAMERFPGRDFQAIDLAKYNAPAGMSFDVIVFNEVLPHVREALAHLRRYLAWLKPNGFAAISTYQNANPTSNALIFAKALRTALSNGEFEELAACEVINSNNLKWRVDVIAPIGRTDVEI